MKYSEFKFKEFCILKLEASESFVDSEAHFLD